MRQGTEIICGIQKYEKIQIRGHIIGSSIHLIKSTAGSLGVSRTKVAFQISSLTFVDEYRTIRINSPALHSIKDNIEKSRKTQWRYKGKKRIKKIL